MKTHTHIEIAATYNNHHHTVQLATFLIMYNIFYQYVYTLMSTWLVETTISAQVAVGGDSKVASQVCTFGKKNAQVGTRKSPSVQVPGDAHCKCK